MNKRFNTQAQGGFTLIELIVVIVILGILAATALPKFANLGGDARLASLNAAKGALASGSAIVHGKILVTPGAVTTTTTPNTLALENTNIEVANGYPMASSGGIMVAAGLSADDYTVITEGAAGDTRPAVTTGQIAVVPKSIAGTATAKNCYVTYTGATASAAPVVALSTTASTANCE